MKLAKRSLDEKWYLIRDQPDMDETDDCPFCEDAIMRRQELKPDKDGNKPSQCMICYVVVNNSDLCADIDYDMEPEEVNDIIRRLEILAKKGRFK